MYKVMKWFGAHRWFALAASFFLLNLYGVWRLEAAYRSSERAVRITFEPDSGSPVAPGARLSWIFSEPLVSETETGQWFDEGPVTLEPGAPGRFLWEGRDRLVFVPRDGWNKATAYTATLDRGLRSLSGNRLQKKRMFSFRVSPLKFLSARQVNLGENREATLELKFNHKVDPALLGEAVRLTLRDGEEIGWEVLGATPGRVLTLKLDPVPEDILVLFLKRSLKSTEGPLELDENLRREIKIQDHLVISSLQAKSTSWGNNRLIARFNGPIDVARASEFIRVKPPLKERLHITQTHSRGRAYQVHGPFEPGTSYTLTFEKGLPHANGSRLTRSVSRPVFFPDRPPAVRFETGGHVLSPRGRMQVMLSSVNVSRATLRIRRIYNNNLVQYAMRDGRHYRNWYGRPADMISGSIAQQEIRIDPENPNQARQTPIPLAPLLEGQTGAFELVLTAPKAGTIRHLVAVSDTGLTLKAAGGDLLVWANSLHTLEPVQDAEVRVYSRENQLLQEGRTDARGLVRIPPGESPGNPFLITLVKDEDISFLRLDRTRIHYPEAQGVRSYAGKGYEAFVFTDRGIYRPGETLHAKAVVRGARNSCPDPFPVTLKVTRPDGRLKTEVPGLLNKYAAVEFECSWSEADLLGRYQLQLTIPGTDELLGAVMVSVEEFAPPRIKVDADFEKSRYPSGAPIRLNVNGRYLFGAPAAGCSVRAQMEILPETFTAKDWPGYTFRDSEKSFTRINKNIGTGRLDEAGEGRFELVPELAGLPPSSLKVLFSTTVTEPSGRSVTAFAACRIDPYPFYVGLRRDPVARPVVGSPVSVELVLVTPDGSPASFTGALQAEVARVTWSTVLEKGSDGVYRYRSYRRFIDRKRSEIEVQDGVGRFRFTPGEMGTYRVRVAESDSQSSSSITLYAGSKAQEWSPRSMQEPDRVELMLDRDHYRPGETATLTLRAPFAGKALVTVEADKILEKWVVNLEKNTAEIPVPVKDGYWPNVHCSVSLIRPVQAGHQPGVHRAVGSIPLKLSSETSRLAVDIHGPEHIRPKQPLPVRIQLKDSNGAGRKGEVVLAAVDEGICMLTGFATPDPMGYFHALRRNEVVQYDLYSDLMPEWDESVLGTASHMAGGSTGLLRGRLNPIKGRRFKPVAIWMASVETDAEGRAEFSVPVPEFTGALRLMAVAVNREQFGSAARTVEVKRPFVVHWSLPRFLAPEDRFRIPFEVLNLAGETRTARVRLQSRGPVRLVDPATGDPLERLESEFRLEAGATGRLQVQAACEIFSGKAEIICRVEVGGEVFEETLECPVRPAAALQVVHGEGMLDGGRSETLNLPADWVPGTGEYTLNVSGWPSVKLAGGLDYLLRYPYGCVEQTTSASFPLLYLPELSRLTGSASQVLDTRQYVQHGIERLLSMQLSGGGFGYWPRSTSLYKWGSIYATEFLVEARKAGYRVPKSRIRAAVQYLEASLSGSSKPGKFSDQAEWRRRASLCAYTCYVLGLAGQPQPGWVARLSELEDRLDKDSRIYLLLARGMGEERKEAWEGLQRLVPVPPAPSRDLGHSLRSPARSHALMLSACVDFDPRMPELPQLVHALDATRVGGRWYTTQENAMALMALGKYARYSTGRSPAFRAEIQVNGRARSLASEDRPVRLELEDLKRGKVRLKNLGDDPLFYAWQSRGVPTRMDEPEVDQGLRVRRRYLSSSGIEISPDSLQPGDLVVVEWAVENPDRLENLVIEGLLPAGLEIENDRLKTSQQVSWVKPTLPVRHREARDDRMLVFPQTFSGKKLFYYMARAVTPGTYTLPPLKASCMYAPDQKSIHGKGTLRVLNSSHELL